MIILGLCLLFLNKNISFGYSLETPWQGASNEHQQHMFWGRNNKNLSQNYQQKILPHKSSDPLSGVVYGWDLIKSSTVQWNLY